MVLKLLSILLTVTNGITIGLIKNNNDNNKPIYIAPFAVLQSPEANKYRRTRLNAADPLKGIVINGNSSTTYIVFIERQMTDNRHNTRATTVMLS